MDFIKTQEAIPTHELPEDDRECAICTTEYGHRMADGRIEHAVKLSCKHIAGSLCLQQWLTDNTQCAFCRIELFPKSREPRGTLARNDRSEMRETTIGEEEERLLDEFEMDREPTADEVDEREATASSSSILAEREFNMGASVDTVQRAKTASLRRRADWYSRVLYDEFRGQQIRSGDRESEILPRLTRWEAASGSLGWESDLKLFNHLRGEGAFNLSGMFELRFKLSDPSDACLYEHLRDHGYRWDIARHGWFRFGRRMLFDDAPIEVPAVERDFQRLTLQGAFRTLGVTRSFRDVHNLSPDNQAMLTPTDWQIYTQIRNDRMHWHEDDRCWWDEDHESVGYGDLPSSARIRSEKISEDEEGTIVYDYNATAEIINHIDNLYI